MSHWVYCNIKSAASSHMNRTGASDIYPSHLVFLFSEEEERSNIFRIFGLEDGCRGVVTLTSR